MTILLTILGLSLLIILHELGHFLVARLFGMRVLRFSVGFGPRVWGVQLGETMWQLAAIPLGGFVQIDGMGPPDPDTQEDARSFCRKPRWQRALVLFAGPAFNWLLAALFVAVLAFTVGFKRYNFDSSEVGTVTDGPAKRAGVKAGDRIVAVGGTPVDDWQGLVDQIGDHSGEPVAFTIERDGARFALLIASEKQEDDRYRIGIEPSGEVLTYGLFDAIAFGFVGAFSMTMTQLSFLRDMIAGDQEGEFIGPPGIVRELTERAKRGLRYLLEALAGLSITLFLINLLPIPALDGSRLLFVGIETVRRRPVDQRIEAVVHSLGFVLLLGLIIFFSIRDLT